MTKQTDRHRDRQTRPNTLSVAAVWMAADSHSTMPVLHLS